MASGVVGFVLGIAVTDQERFELMKSWDIATPCPNGGELPIAIHCPKCVLNQRYSCGGRHRGHVGYVPIPERHRRGEAMGKYAKKTTQATSESGPAGKIDDNTAKHFEALVEMMTLAAWEDGTARQTSTVTFFAENGGLKACLSDRDGLRTAWMTGSSFVELLKGLEEGLRKDSLDWRAQKQQAGKSPSRQMKR